MSSRDQMLSCSACRQSFIGEPEACGLDFCSEDCAADFWEEQLAADERIKKLMETRNAKDV